MRRIELTKGQVALVDDQDYEELIKYKWFAAISPSGYTYYAARSGVDQGKNIKMHRHILGLTDPKVKVDHKDRNGLNNQRDNLRIATHAQNLANRRIFKNSKSGYKGVSWVKRDKSWKAYLKKDGKEIDLGRFNNVVLAAKAYNEAALKYHGEFAILNKIEGL